MLATEPVCQIIEPTWQVLDVYRCPILQRLCCQELGCIAQRRCSGEHAVANAYTGHIVAVLAQIYYHVRVMPVLYAQAEKKDLGKELIETDVSLGGPAQLPSLGKVFGFHLDLKPCYLSKLQYLRLHRTIHLGQPSCRLHKRRQPQQLCHPLAR